ncbi:MAG TPA: hypothetical protein VNV66_09330 [Pilimelia sp.]|nr:hypothetical protein [Pilimelia sp.]
MRVRLSMLTFGAAVLLGGCAQAAAQPPQPPQREAVEGLSNPVAAAAGGACALLDFAAVRRTLGVTFDVAAATGAGRTRSCVLRATAARHPDLLLTESRTTADAAAFGEEVRPSGARRVTGLGRAAYRATVAPTRGRGPAVEIGWLTADGRLLTLRHTLAAGAPAAAAAALGGRLHALATEVDAAAAKARRS